MPGLGRVVVAGVALTKGADVVVVAVTTGIEGSGRVVERHWVGVEVVGMELAVVAITRRMGSSDGVGEGSCQVAAVGIDAAGAIGGGT